MSAALTIRQVLLTQKKIVQPISGISMLPMLDEDKDAVELVAVEAPLNMYDVVLFQRKNGQLVLHRIIAVKKNHYLICGDNSLAVEKVPQESILAVATGFYKDGKYVSCRDEEYLAYVLDRWKDFSTRKLIEKTPKEETPEAVEERARKAIKKQGRGKYIWSRIFVPYHQMCMYYPCLWKFPVLLPVFWAVRPVKSLFDGKKRRRLKGELTAMTKKQNG